MRNVHRLLAACSAAIVAACSSTTTISSTQPDAKVTVRTSQQTAAPRSETFSTTSFGNYEFQAAADGYEPMHGLLPLKFNGGYLALDILFFAPATFFNLREVYPYYEFDLAKRVVRYKQKPEQEWSTYVPLATETERAKKALSTN